MTRPEQSRSGHHPHQTTTRKEHDERTTTATITKAAGTLAAADEPEALARAFWTYITEPNDPIAGELIATLGLVEALDVAMRSHDVTDSDDRSSLKERLQSRANRSQFERVLRAAARFGVQLVTPDSVHCPKGMNDLGVMAPVALWVRGSAELPVASDQIAIVVERHAQKNRLSSRHRDVPSFSSRVRAATWCGYTST